MRNSLLFRENSGELLWEDEGEISLTSDQKNWYLWKTTDVLWSE
jgi:hypothetical protein